jgi:hypothetical protein
VRSHKVLTDFSAGEISPLSMGRVNTEQYASACQKLENYIVSARGGVRRRGGMNYVQTTKNNSPARLIPFVFNRDQSYIIELGDKYMRFYREHGILLEGSTSRQQGDRIDHRYLGSGTGPVTPTDAYEVETPWGIEDVWDLTFAQANDVMIMVHPAYPVKQLGRYGAADWRLEDPPFVDPPWTAETGYPRTVAFFQQRLWFGGSPTKPQTIWASRVADFFNFTINEDPDESAPDDSLALTIASLTQEAIQWLDSQQVLLIGTSGSEQRLTPDSYIAVNNLPNIARTSTYGSRNIMPVRIGDLTIFVQGSGRQVRSYSQNIKSAVERYVSHDLAWFAEHITESGVIAQSYQLIPDSVLWQVRADGVLLSMTHDPSIDGATDYASMGWARHPTQGDVISVCTIPFEQTDETWVCSKRNGNYIVEYINDAVFTDACLTTPPDNDVELPGVGGLSHLEGEEVQVIVDDGIQTDKIVVGGQVVFDSPGKKVEVGLGYVSTLQTVPYNDAASAGTSLGTSQRWAQMYIKIVDSALPLVNGSRPAVRTPSTPMNTPQELTTGDYEILDLGWNDDGIVNVVQDLPKKTQLVAVYGVYQGNGG